MSCNGCCSDCDELGVAIGPPGEDGATGPQGPAGGVGSIVNITSANSPYTITGAEGVVLVDTTLGAVTVNLLAANNPLVVRPVAIKDAFGTSGSNAITIVPNGSNTIETFNTSYIINIPFASRTFVSNGTIGYNII